jgi:hypothetical protein
VYIKKENEFINANQNDNLDINDLNNIKAHPIPEKQTSFEDKEDSPVKEEDLRMRSHSY